MSVVDNRVVQLLFDNKQFESGVKESTQSLNNLNRMLDNTGATSAAGVAVQELAEKFNHLGIIGVTAIQNIANRITDSLINTIKSVSVDQLTAGFNKYEDKIKSVQTIMSATKKSWRQDANDMVISSELVAAGFDKNMIDPLFKLYETYVDKGEVTAKQMKEMGVSSKEWAAALPILRDSLAFTGSQMDYVNDQLDKLNWFTDETSYNFTDMTSNIGKFTSQGVPLSTAVTSMEGIATWAAAAGQGTNEASRAMYNMSQALGVGAVKLQDWKSIENANMATEQFKEQALKAAVAVGTLTEKNGKYYTQVKKGGKAVEVNIKNFSSTLQQGWFTSDALLKTLDVYGGFATEIGDLTASFGDLNVSTTDLLEGLSYIEDNIDPADEAFSNWIDKMTNKGVDIDDLIPKLEKLAGEEYEIGREAFRAGQEAKTFTDAIEAVKDGVSTAWMNLFETVFGNYEEAKQIWTELANSAYTLFAEPVNLLNDLLENVGAGEWAGKAVAWVTKIADAVGIFLDSRGDDIITAGTWIFKFIGSTIKSFADFCKSIFDPIKTAFRNIFPEKTGAEIAAGFMKLIAPISALFRTFKANTETGDKIRRTFEGIFSIVGLLTDAFGAAVQVIGEIIPQFKGIGDGILDGTASIGDFIVSLRDSIKENDTFYKTFKKIADFIVPIIKTIFDIGGKVFNFLAGLFDKAKESGAIDTIANAFSNLKEKLVPLSTIFERISNIAKTVWDFIKGLYDSIKEFISGIDFSQIDFGSILKTGIGAGAGIGAISVLKNIADFIKNGGIGKGLIDKLGEAVDALTGIFDKLGKAVQSFANDKNATAFLKVAGALLVLAIALAAFTFVSQMEGIDEGILMMVAAFGVLLGALKLLEKISPKVSAVATALLLLSVSMLILAGAMAAFALIVKMESAWTGFALMAATLGVVTAALFAMGKIGAKVIIAAAALMILAAAMIVLAIALAAFAAVAMMPTFGTGLAAFAGVLILVVAALAVLGQVGAKVIIAAAAMMILSVAMLVLAGALAAFAAVAMMDTFTTGLGTMILMLVLFVAALAVLGEIGPTVIIAAAALLILSVAMVVLAGALAAFAAVAMMDTFGAGLAAMVLTLVILTAALIALGAAGPMVIVGAAALLIGAAAIGVLALALIAGSVAIMVFSGALYALGGAITGVAGMIVSLIFDTIDRASETLVIVADSIGQAVDLLFEGLGSAIESLGSGIGAAIEGIGEGIAQAIEDVIASIGEGIGRGLEGIGEGIDAIGEGVSTVGSGISEVGSGIETFGNGMRSLKGIAWVEIAAGLSQVVGPIRDLGNADISSTVSGISQIAGAMNDIIAASAAMGNAGIAGVNALANGIKSGGGRVSSAASSVAKQGASAANQSASWRQAGVNCVAGLINGIQSQLTAAYNKGKELGQKTLEGFNTGVGNASPSKKFRKAGEYIVEGLIIGIDENANRAVASVESMALATVGTASEILANAIKNDYTNPVIRPTLDLSNVAAGAAGISSMFGQQSVGVNGEASTASRSQSGVTYNYTQNNYSPRALDRIEIYRQTKNQINASNVLASV